MRKLILLGIISSMCIFTLGCSNTEETNTKENTKEINSIEKTAKNEDFSKITMSDSISEIKDKIYNACVSYKETKTMDESVEYVKSILPDGTEEIERKYDEIKKLTYVKYGLGEFIFHVCYLHNPTEDTDSNLTEGITFPLVEVNVTWNSSDQKDNKIASKINLEDSLSEVENKINSACVWGKEEKTMDDSLEYVKSILPDGTKETEREYDEVKKLTYVKYGVEDFIFHVCYLHNPIENTGLNVTEGITFPRVDINANWNSSDQ